MALDSLQAFSEQTALAAEKVISSTVRIEGHRGGAGSGIVWSENGVVLTANHVVEHSRDAKVVLEGKAYQTEVIGGDAGSDIALLRIQATGLPAVEAGDSTKLRPGHRVFAVGRPWNEEAIVKGGIVSAIGRAGSGNGREQFRDGMIHLALILFPGFSGGPLADAGGRVVGLNTMVIGGDMGLAVPTETIRRIAGQLLQDGRVKKGYLGIGVEKVPLSESTGRKLGLNQETALMILTVEDGGAAHKAGVLPGDILVGLDGSKFSRVRELHSWLSTKSNGHAVAAHIVRGGKLMDLPITVETR